MPPPGNELCHGMSFPEGGRVVSVLWNCILGSSPASGLEAAQGSGFKFCLAWPATALPQPPHESSNTGLLSAHHYPACPSHSLCASVSPNVQQCVSVSSKTVDVFSVSSYSLLSYPLIFLLGLFVLFHVFCPNMCSCPTCMQTWWVSEEAIRCPGTGVRDGPEPYGGCWDSNPGPLKNPGRPLHSRKISKRNMAWRGDAGVTCDCRSLVFTCVVFVSCPLAGQFWASHLPLLGPFPFPSMLSPKNTEFTSVFFLLWLNKTLSRRMACSTPVSTPACSYN